MHGHSSGGVRAAGITKQYGDAVVLANVSLSVEAGDRVGVVGSNGIGKSTLLRALAGLEPVDGGSVIRVPPSASVGFLPQEQDHVPGETLRQYVGRRTGIAPLARRLEAIAARLEAEPGLAAEYASTLDRFVTLGGPDLDARARQAFGELGLRAELDEEVSALSGGEAARAALATILLSRFDVLLLDEPTNDLDFAGLERLEAFLDATPAGVALVSHDRAFLGRTVDRVVELEEGTRTARVYGGGWEEFERMRARAREEHHASYERYRAERRRFEELRSVRRDQARTGGKQANRRATHALMSKTRSAAKRLERLDAARVEKPWEPWELRLDLATGRRSGDVVVRLARAVVRRGEFRLGPVDLDVRWGDRLAVVGANGSGKSTLLGALVGRFPLAAGTRRAGPSVVFGELRQEREVLTDSKTLLDAFLGLSGVNRESARTLLAKFGLGAGDVLRPAPSLSPGERTRAEVALLAARGVNCLVLDEPTNHLDLPAIEELESALDGYDGTLLLVSHDRRLLAGVRLTGEFRLPL